MMTICIQYQDIFRCLDKILHTNRHFKAALCVLHRKEQIITETSQVNIEGLGLLLKTIFGVLRFQQKPRNLSLFLIKQNI